MWSRHLLLLSLGLALAPYDAAAESCADPSEALELELRSVSRVDGGEAADDELARWAAEGSATVGFKGDSFEHAEGTIRFENIFSDASLALEVALEEAS